MLLPCYNAGRFLSECIASLEAQTFPDFEIIAVDDGSTDETTAIVTEWAARDCRVRLFAPGRVGLVAALHHAGNAARGELLARMDADDVAAPERLQRQIEQLREHRDIAACGSRVRYFPSKDVRVGARAYQDWLNSLTAPEEIARDIFVECPIAHPALMVRAAAFSAVGGYREQPWPEDYDLVLRLWSAGHLLANVPDLLLHWRERPDRLSRTDPRYSLDAFRRCKVFYLVRTIVKQRPVVICGAGPVGKAMARELIAQGATLRAFIDIDPRKIGQTVYGVPVCAPGQLGELRGNFVLAAVADAEARREIRSVLAAGGLRELSDFCAVA